MSEKSQRPNIIGEHIKARRLDVGMSLQDVATRANVSRSTVSRIENGLLLPSVDVLVAIGGALELDLTELLAKLGAKFGQELPEFSTYLRVKYNLADESIARVDEFLRAEIENKETEK